MRINRQPTKIFVKFEQRDWNCGRAKNVIEDIKTEIPRAAWDYDAENRTWIITRSMSVEATFDAICLRHLVDPNQMELFKQPDLFQQAA